MRFIKQFKNIRMRDVELVGGKNASLGQMVSCLSSKGIMVPDGFAITSQAYWYFLKKNKIFNELKSILDEIKFVNDINNLENISIQVRALIEQSPIPNDLEEEILIAFDNLRKQYAENFSVAVRSSATVEDSPNASFAGQQETFLNIQCPKILLESYKKCLSSLFTQRAIIYRNEQNFDHLKVGISVGIQKMIRSDLSCSGVCFTLDTETGFNDVVFINSSYGLGESIVQGMVNPDSFYVHKPTLQKGFKSILKKEMGKKEIKTIYSDIYENHVTTVPVDKELQNKFSLTDDEIIQVAKMSILIEKYYSKINGKFTPMDIEWAKDGIDNKIYIVQARFETVHSKKKEKRNIYTKFTIKDESKLNELLITTGQAVGQKIATGRVKVINSVSEIYKIEKGDILVTKMTDPDWVPIMKKVSGIITDQGGRTCHTAIVSRELGIPAILGTGNATKLLKDGSQITLDCSQGQIGKIYEGFIPFEKKEIEIKKLKKLKKIDLLINTASPDQAFEQSFLPVQGVGLARIEFIISNNIKIHPLALIRFNELIDSKVKEQIENLTFGYQDKKKFFIDKLAEQAGTIAAAFYPRPVTIRLSDFKSNEYRNLIGGIFFEPKEENPMIGLRGASRYYSDIYKEAFELECAAMKKIRDEMGLKNIKIMIPFVRTIEEAKNILKIMKQFGLKRKKDLEIIMMCEVPSNVILIDKFSKYFDGFSIGSNDLTQLTLAIDRDSYLLNTLFDEKNEAIKRMLKMAIDGAKKFKKQIGICGQGPSDYPLFRKFLIKCGINSISLNPDTIISFLSSE